MAIYYVPCTGAKELFAPGPLKVGDYSTVVDNIRCPHILSKCPHCGLEMVHVWNYNSFSHDGTIQKKAVEQLRKEYNYEEVEQRIVNEIFSFLKKPVCPNCSGKLLFSPGFFLLDLGSLFYKIKMVDYDKEAAEQFFKHGYFRYPDTEMLISYVQDFKNALDEFELNPYDFNKLTEEFLKNKGIFDDDTAEDMTRRLVFILLAEGEKQIAYSSCIPG